jgi:hypothetical protein
VAIKTHDLNVSTSLVDEGIRNTPAPVKRTKPARRAKTSPAL